MSIMQDVFESIISLSSVIVLFFSLNCIKYSVRALSVAVILKIPVAVFIILVNTLVSSQLFTYLELPLYALLLAVVFLKSLPKALLVFYGLFSIRLNNIFYRSITYFVLPLFGQVPGIIEDNLTYTLIILSSFCFVFLFLRWLGYDFLKLRTDKLSLEDRKVLYLANWAMIAYYTIMQILTYLEHEQGITTLAYRQLFLVLYLIVFMGIIKQLDLHLRNKLQEQLDFQQRLQLKNLKTYSHHVEDLYREVKGFRHDYTNLLMTLRLAIEDNDMEQVKDVYESVIEDSHKKFRQHKYELGRLLNIQESALKSLLATKFIQAAESNVLVTIEVPEPIALKGMSLVDIVTIVSILFDNALEAALETSTPKIDIAFLNKGNKQMFIIENSIKEEAIDISEIYLFGHSSKGIDRGIGLYNVVKILEHYPHVALNTTSQSHKFCQVLEIGRPA